MPVNVILGLQYGDEGKGKICDLFAADYDYVLRFQGGNNAGHTIYQDGKKIVLHLVPSGVLYPHTSNLIGPGVVVDPEALEAEVRSLLEQGISVNDPNRLRISSRCPIILPLHRELDRLQGAKVGTTGRGIGPAYVDMINRLAIRVGDLRLTDNELMQKIDAVLIPANLLIKEMEGQYQYLTDQLQFLRRHQETLQRYEMMNMTAFLHQLLINDKEVLAEGAQGTLLDVYNGTYPFVTSSFTSVAGVLGYCGIPPQKIGRIFGVFKAYTTRVGNGPFPTELLGDEGNLLREMGREFGATTGRPRRCGWLDLPELAYACRANGVTHLVMTKADILGELPEFKVNTGYHVDELYGSMEFGYTPEIDHLIRAPYNDLTFQGFKSVDDPAFRHFVKTVEGHLYRQINYVSFGPERDALIELAH